MSTTTGTRSPVSSAPSTPSSPRTPSGSHTHAPGDAPDRPYETKKGCLIMLGVFGGLIALAVGAMLVTGLFNSK